jgi:hypothetical protein
VGRPEVPKSLSAFDRPAELSDGACEGCWVESGFLSFECADLRPLKENANFRFRPIMINM